MLGIWTVLLYHGEIFQAGFAQPRFVGVDVVRHAVYASETRVN